MQEVLGTLKNIQELDEDIFRVEQELKRLPAEQQKRRADIDGRIARRDDLEHELRTLRTRIKEIEDHTTIQRQRMRKVETETTKQRDAALLAAFQHEKQSLRREIGEYEEEGLQLVERADELEGQMKALQEEIDAEEAVYAELATNVEKEVAEATAKLEGLTAERAKRLGAGVDREVLNTYERLLQAREGIALAMLDGRICQECYMEVPANVFVKLSRGTELVQCPSCDRILYLPEG